MPVQLFKVKKSKGVRQRRRRRRQQPHILGRYKKREVATKIKAYEKAHICYCSLILERSTAGSTPWRSFLGQHNLFKVLMIHLLSLCLSDAREFLMRHFRFRFGFFFESLRKNLKEEGRKRERRTNFKIRVTQSHHALGERALRRYRQIKTNKEENKCTRTH